MHAGEDAYVRDPAIPQQVKKHGDNVACAIGREQRAAESLGLPRIEWTRQREPELAAAGRSGTAMRADHRGGLAHRATQLADRIAREELGPDFALRAASLLQRRQGSLRCARQREH